MKLMKRLLILLMCLPIIASAQTTGIKWTTNLSWQQIKAKAKAENKYIFLDVYATWCAPCKEMDKNVYVNDSVGNFFNDRFISVKVQMDKTAKDGEEVKRWYKDAEAIANLYDIDAFPSFIFLNPQAITTDLHTGYKSVKEFVNIAQTTMQPDKKYNNVTLDNYYSLVAEFHKGKINYQALPSMIRFATRLDTVLRGELMKIYKDHLIRLKPSERYTKQNIEFWPTLNLGFQSPLFNFFLRDGNKIDEIMGYKGYAADVVDKEIQKQIVTPFLKEQNTRKELPMSGMYLTDPSLKADSTEADWHKLHQIIKEQFNKKITRRNVLLAQIEWYQRHYNYYKFCKFSLFKWNKYKPDIFKGPIQTMNGAAWAAFLHISDIKLLEGYVIWMRNLVDARPDKAAIMDTYANLLYKIGRRQEAMVCEKKAILLEGGRYARQFQGTLEKMKAGLPTNGVAPIVKYN